MIDGRKKRNRQLAFELQNSHVCEKRSNHEFKQCVQGNNLQTNYCCIHAKVETQSNQCLWSTLFNVHRSKMKSSSWSLLFVDQFLDSL